MLAFAIYKSAYAIYRSAYAIYKQAYAFYKQTYAIYKSTFAIYMSAYAIYQQTYAIYKSAYRTERFVRQEEPPRPSGTPPKEGNGSGAGIGMILYKGERILHNTQVYCGTLARVKVVKPNAERVTCVAELLREKNRFVVTK